MNKLSAYIIKHNGFLPAMLIIWGITYSSLTMAAPFDGCTLKFYDEFSSFNLDTSKWQTKYWWGGRSNTGNNEAQYYTDNAFRLDKGVLYITAKKQKVENYNYTSGMITSNLSYSQQYGYIEIRARVPKGRGFWPAFWLLSQKHTWPPEIDVFEHLGHEPNVTYFGNIYTDASGVIQSNNSSYIAPVDLTQGFHQYSIKWTPSSITWFLDRQPRYVATKGLPHEPMYILANLAVGGKWPGYPDVNTVFPNTFAIDYIRLYDCGDTQKP